VPFAPGDRRVPPVSVSSPANCTQSDICEHPALQARIISQCADIISVDADGDPDEAVLAMLRAFAPRDSLEGHLAAQLLVIHATAMRCLARAALGCQKDAVRDAELRHAEKLFNLFSRLLETFEKRRTIVALDLILEKSPLSIPRRR
jgi:hypothetical protein